MSDGNFNTKLLAPGGFASGVRAGEARMKQRALQALQALLAAQTALSETDRQELYADFKQRLD